MYRGGKIDLCVDVRRDVYGRGSRGCGKRDVHVV